MAITKPEFWLGSLAFIMILSFALLLFGNSLLGNENLNLDNDSREYLTDYSRLIGTTGIEDRATSNIDDEETQNPIRRRLNTIRDFVDVFGVFTLLSNILGGFWSFISLAFNLPSFFIETLGLPLGNFKFLINILGLILSLSATIMLVRLVK